MIKLYGYFRSSAVYRTRIALNLKGMEAKIIPVHLLSNGGQQHHPDYLARQPQGLVPALEADGRIFGQSLAIIEWLDETCPTPPLLPAEPDLRARIRWFAQIIACDIHPLQNLRILNYLQEHFEQDQQGKSQWCQRWIGDGLAACEKLIIDEDQRRGHPSTFCFGDAPGLADILLVPQLFSSKRFSVDLNPMPRLRAIGEACDQLPAFIKAHPTQQDDYEA